MCLKKKSKLLSQFGAEILEFKVGRCPAWFSHLMGGTLA